MQIGCSTILFSSCSDIPSGFPRRTTAVMRPSLKYTGVAAVVTAWTTLLAATTVSGLDLLGAEPLSYMGTRRASAALFVIGLAVPAVLLVAFHNYVRNRHRVGVGFSLAMLVGLAGQMVAAFVPIDGEPPMHWIHTASALILGASLPILMWRFAAGQPPGPWRRLTYALFWAELAAVATGLYLSSRSVAPLAEILPGAVFQAWILTVTFTTLAITEGSARRNTVGDIELGRWPARRTCVDGTNLETAGP